MGDHGQDSPPRARPVLLVVAFLIAGIAAYVAPARSASSDPMPPQGMSTTASVGGTAQTGIAPSGPLTGLAAGSTVTITMSATGPSAGNFFGAEARLCRGGLAIIFQAQYNPTQGGNCLPPTTEPTITNDTYGATNDRDVIVTSDPARSSATIVFQVGSGSVTFQANSTSTVTCDAANPCALWIKEQFSTTLLSSGSQFLHYDLQYGSASTVPSTSTTLGATTTTTAVSATTTTTGAATTSTTISATTTTTTPAATSTTAPTSTSTSAPTSAPTSTTKESTTTSVVPPTSDPASTAPANGGLIGLTGAPTTHLVWSAAGIVFAGVLLVLVGSRSRRRGP